MKCECIFCTDNRFLLNKKLNLPGKESIIWEDENIYVAPDLFPLSIGHFLIIPKKHYASFGNVPENVFKSSLNARLFLKEKVFAGKHTITFEHGAVVEHSGGASIDHAHIHIIPLNIDLEEKITRSGFVQTSAISGEYASLVDLAKQKKPYIFFQHCNFPPIAFVVKQLPSQFLRLLIAEDLKIEYDWKLLYEKRSSKELFLKTLNMAKGNLNEKFI